MHMTLSLYNKHFVFHKHHKFEVDYIFDNYYQLVNGKMGRIIFVKKVCNE